MAADWMGMSAAARDLNCSAQMVRVYADRGDLDTIRLENGQRIVSTVSVDRLRRKREAAQRRKARH